MTGRAARGVWGGFVCLLVPGVALAQGSAEARVVGTDGVVTIAFAGDVMMAARVGDAIARHGVHYPWEGVRSSFERADFVVVNLETAVAHGGTAEDKQFTFRSEPHTLEGLAAAGVDLVTLANNHSLDYGATALLETLEHLERYGVRAVGAGADAEAAYAAQVVTFGDLRVGFIGVSRVYPYVHWPATDRRAGVASGYDYALPEVLRAVDGTRPTVDALFVLVHWGRELADEPRDIDLAFADSMLAHGVTGVIGHHPHVLQGFRFSPKTGIVAWSLGNFVFRSFREVSRPTVVLFVDVAADGSLVAARVEPMYIDDLRPRPAGDHAATVLDRIRRLSAPFGTDVAEDGRLLDPEFERKRLLIEATKPLLRAH